jgi:nitrate reductase molybdenum cofactor assembly chaperone NarJ/NarW
MPDAAIYNALVALLTYPESDYPQRIDASVGVAPEDCREQLEQFAAQMRGLRTDQLQELFTQTFDLNPTCSLELGWHLFGENYERGLLLVRVREELRRHGLAESTELPDHLTHVLQLMERMEHETAADFAAACVLPALEKMLRAMCDKKNPFENVLLAVRSLLRSEFPEIPLTALESEPLLKVLV